MKKLLLGALAALTLVGAGCRVPLFSNQVEGEWYLQFDLPEGWVMAADYQEPRDKAVTPNQTLSRELSDILIQSTEKAIVDGELPPEAGVDASTYVSDNFAQIRAYRLESRSVIPSDAEDLGNGFFKSGSTYYFEAEDGDKYKFTYIVRGDVSEDDVANVILTAEEVTVFTDASTVQADVETK